MINPRANHGNVAGHPIDALWYLSWRRFGLCRVLDYSDCRFGVRLSLEMERSDNIGEKGNVATHVISVPKCYYSLLTSGESSLVVVCDGTNSRYYLISMSRWKQKDTWIFAIWTIVDLSAMRTKLERHLDRQPESVCSHREHGKYNLQQFDFCNGMLGRDTERWQPLNKQKRRKCRFRDRGSARIGQEFE